MAMSDFAVKIQNVSVSLGKGFKALKDVSVDLPTGKIIGFIGPSGAGKTTLIRSIVGRQKLASGNIEVFGLPAGSSRLREQVSYMTQEPSVYPDLTVRENLTYFATIFGIPKANVPETVKDILATVDLTKQANQLVQDVSGGQKQRVSLAIALIGYPKLLVLDEPTVGLDPVLREQMWQLFHELAAKGSTIIISSHVMDEAERCDDLLLIRDGKILVHGSPIDLRKRTETSSVEQVFLKLVGSHA
jgi:ABC-2 type transport system ATP-binding protein